MKYLLLTALGLALCAPLYAETESCPMGTEDMMNYFTMGYPNRLSNNMGPGNANPVYTNIFPDLGESFSTSGYFLWAKSSIGYPWDIKSFDQKYIYDRTTESSWTDPTTFKRFATDLPMSPRCVKIGREGPAIRISSANTNYSTYANCLPTLTQNLGYVINTVSAPAMVNTGGNLGTVKTRYFIYTYSCNSKYEDCAYQEVYSLGYGVGLYDWKYYQNNKGHFILASESVMNQFDSGSATPYLPCSSSYE